VVPAEVTERGAAGDCSLHKSIRSAESANGDIGDDFSIDDRGRLAFIPGPAWAGAGVGATMGLVRSTLAEKTTLPRRRGQTARRAEARPKLGRAHDNVPLPFSRLSLVVDS